VDARELRSKLLLGLATELDLVGDRYEREREG
jgi:hypothetical protein